MSLRQQADIQALRARIGELEAAVKALSSRVDELTRRPARKKAA